MSRKGIKLRTKEKSREYKKIKEKEIEDNQI